MKLAEWLAILGKALFVGLLWGAAYYIVVAFFHPSQSTQMTIAVAVIVLWVGWAVIGRRR